MATATLSSTRHRRAAPRRRGRVPARASLRDGRPVAAAPARPRLRRPHLARHRPLEPGSAQPQLDLCPRPARGHGLRLDPPGRPGHRALRRRVVRAEPRVLRPREDRRARDRGRLQRRRLDVRRARRRVAASGRTRSRSSSRSTTTSCSPIPNEFDQIMFGTVKEAVEHRRRRGRRDDLLRLRRRPTGRSWRSRAAFAEAHELGHGDDPLVLPAQPRVQEGRRRLRARGRPDRPGQPPRRDDRGRHHQAEAADHQRRLQRRSTSARPPTPCTRS